MKISNAFAGAGLLVLPFIVSDAPGEVFRDPKALFLAIMFGLSIAMLLWREVHPSLGCAAGLLFVYAAGTAMVNPAFQLLTLTATFGSCLWIAHPTKHDVKRGLEILEISGLLCAGLALLFQLPGTGQTFVKIPPWGLPSAAFGQQTLYGPFAVACFASALFHGRHFRSLLLILPIFVISSSFTFLSLGVVLLLYGFSRFGKKVLLGLLLAGVLLGAYSKFRPTEVRELTDDKSRFALWAQTARLGSRHWLLGHGFASFRVIYPIFQDHELRKANGIDDSKQSPEMLAFFAEAARIKKASGTFLHPHNEPLLVFFQFGCLGLGIAVWWVWVFVITAFHGPIEAYYYAWIFRERREAWKKIDASTWALVAIFFSFLANAMGNFPFHLIPQALLPLWAFVAVTTQKEDGILEADAT